MAKLYELNEVLNGVGNGWLEEHFDENPDEGEEEITTLEQCAWVHGAMVNEDGDLYSAAGIEKYWNVRNGVRIWNDKPTDAERAAEKWGNRE